MPLRLTRERQPDDNGHDDAVFVRQAQYVLVLQLGSHIT